MKRAFWAEVEDLDWHDFVMLWLLSLRYHWRSFESVGCLSEYAASDKKELTTRVGRI